MQDTTPPKKPLFIYIVSLLSAVGGFLFGYDTGIVSGAMVLLRTEFHLSYIWQELIVSVTIAFAWLFSSIAGYFTDKYGRRPVIFISSIIFTIGALAMGIAYSKWTLFIGRAIIGIGIGLASMSVPMYIAEVSPRETRGMLVTLNNCFITGGQFVAAVAAGLFSYYPDNIAWRLMLGFAGLPSILQFIGFFFMPESPRWLIRNDKEEEARRVLHHIRGDNYSVDKEIDEIKEEVDREINENSAKSGVMMRILKSQNVRKALVVGCGLQIIQQLTGINTVMYYSATILQMSGVYDARKAIWLSAITASVNFVFTFVGLYLVERAGRRKLSLASLSGVTIGLVTLAIGFQAATINPMSVSWKSSNIQDNECSKLTNCISCISSHSCGFCYQDHIITNASCLKASSQDFFERSYTHPCSGKSVKSTVWAYDWCPSDYSWLVLVGMALYLLMFASGMGPMPWTINTEIYPLWARSSCYSIATSCNWASNLLVSLTFLTLTRAITNYGAFWLYSGFAVLGFIFLWFFLPETKGIPLENVESLFDQKSVAKKSQGDELNNN